jgi:hypothetical protein
VLAEPGVHEGQRVPREGQGGGVAGRRTRLEGLPAVAARQLVVPQAGVAFPEARQGPPLPGRVGGLPEQRQGLPGLRDRLGPFAPDAAELANRCA